MRIIFVALCCMNAAFAQDTKPKLVHKLGSRLKDGTYHSLTKAFTLKVPDLGAKKITISDRETQPGITADVKFVGDNGAVAGVVTTKIRPDYPKDDSLLDRVKPRYANMARQIGKKFVLTDSKDKTDKASKTKAKGQKKAPRHLQFTFANEKYDEFAFPFGVATVRSDELKTMGIHRLFVRKGYLTEVILLLPTRKNETDKDARKRADKELATVLKTLKFK